ncbi:hypothetical protein [Natrinema versiforme]|uniref:Uncharacterized protein n=1 Tax=Natrinema versiforme JCM 10478 TaxID=1227496 RepID=L9XZ85_9EURY|nr:hypothetical protein [Natrinema versiforme]ELY65913.1 hypothetical protein C489_13668 [Natrinema versiforme JCM 10478]
MQRQTLLTIAISVTLLVGATGAVTAQPANGPPDELPDPVPEFVSDILGAITDFVGGALEALGEVVRGLTPGGDAGTPNGDNN